VWTPLGFIRHLFYNGFHPIFPWVSFMIMGMWLGRQDLRDSVKRKRIFWSALIIALAAESISAYLVQSVSPATIGVSAEDLVYILGSSPYPPLPFYIIAASATAVSVIALCVGLALRFANSAWLKPLIYTGQLALTLYLAHVILGMGLLLALGFIESQSTQFAVIFAIGFFAISVVFAPFLRARFDRGPLENIMRRLST